MDSKTILILADNDNVVPVQNSVNYYLALKKANIPASMYIYPSGGHGFGSSKNYKYYNAMTNDLVTGYSHCSRKKSKY